MKNHTQHPSPHCTCHDEVLAFEAHAGALAAKVCAETVFTQETMPDGRVRHTATHIGFPNDIAHDYLPATASEAEIEAVRQTLAKRWGTHAKCAIDTPEAKAGRAKVVHEHRKEQEQKRREEAAKTRAEAIRAEAARRPMIAGPGIDTTSGSLP